MDATALRVYSQNENSAKIENLEPTELPPGKVRLRVEFSSLNYKDALAITGKGKILKSFPLIPGIDIAGVAIESNHSSFRKNDRVMATGCGLGESVDGGYTDLAVVSGDNLLPIPDNLNFFSAMALGTAGFTAALCLERMENNGQTPKLGPIVITGASGGVGSIAMKLFSAHGYEVVAVSRKKDLADFFNLLGASRVLTPEELHLGYRPLETIRWGGAVDNIGGSVLPGLINATNLWGNVASVGLAAGHEYHASVMPHILRGVNLIGISSNNCPMPLRKKIWQRLSKEFPQDILNEVIVTQTINLNQLFPVAKLMLEGSIHGRVLVRPVAT